VDVRCEAELIDDLEARASCIDCTSRDHPIGGSRA
jgi:hypothetical protein